MGSGKSTVGRILARRLGYRFEDLDARIEREAGRPIREIFHREGEEAFRELEHRALIACSRLQHLVLAVGGGAPIPKRNRDFFRRLAFTVYLDVTFGEFERRVENDPARPMLARLPGEVRALYEARRPVYQELGAQVATDGRTPGEVVEAILELLRARYESPGSSA
jgi:shikimate kinase